MRNTKNIIIGIGTDESPAGRHYNEVIGERIIAISFGIGVNTLAIDPPSPAGPLV